MGALYRSIVALGIDVGGSSVKVVRLEGERVTLLARIPHQARGLDALLEVLVRVPITDGPLGLAVAGLVRADVVARSGNLGLVEAPLRAALEARLGRRLDAFVSDARATGIAALAEPDLPRRVVALALGTGVGGALIEEGRIIKDEGLGHGTLAPEDAPLPCALGHARCLEAHLGAAALARKGGAASAEELDRRAERGDERARAVLHDAGALLARSFDGPILLAGGVAGSRALREGARATLSRFHPLTAAVGAALAAR
ncbi:MAG TPA: ROK family protein [Planctomycetota bacterium]|nr:ROK family protein [Planctomycetota bacterium]